MIRMSKVKTMILNVTKKLNLQNLLSYKKNIQIIYDQGIREKKC